MQKLHTLQSVFGADEPLHRPAAKQPDIFLLFRAADQHGARAEGLAPVDERDAAAGVCQEQCILNCRISAAHDRNVQSLIKRAVADSAVGYAAAGKRIFRRKPQ